MLTDVIICLMHIHIRYNLYLQKFVIIAFVVLIKNFLWLEFVPQFTLSGTYLFVH